MTLSFPQLSRCAGCDAPLASDQRYCVSCGFPCADPRAPLLLPSANGGAVAKAASAPAASARGLPAPRSAAVLALFVLGIGVFIGSAVGTPSGTSLAEGPATRVLVAGGNQGAAPSGAGDTGAQSVEADTDTAAADSGSGTSEADGSSPVASAASAVGDTDDGALGSGDLGEEDVSESGGETPVASTLPPIKHVMAIALSSRSFEELFGKAGASRYLAQELPAQGTLLTHYFAIAHGGLADRIALVSGQAPTPETQAGCPTFSDLLPGKPAADGQVEGRGCVYPKKVETIVDQLNAKGLRGRAYVEDMRDAAGKPATCQHPAVGAADDTVAGGSGSPLTTSSNPFVYFHSIIDVGDCNASVVPLDRLIDDLKAADTTPSFALLVPNRCHDGREQTCPDGKPAGLAAADAFLRQLIPQILGSATFKQDGLLVITSDEAPSTGPHADSQGCCGSKPGPNTPNLGRAAKPGPGGGRVGALLLSRHVTAGQTVTTHYNHYSLLRTVEDLFSLEHLGYASAAGLKAFGEDVWRASE